MNDKDKLISELMKEKGGTREQYLSLLNKIAFHESAGTMDPTMKQIGGGPGRGKYQFEEGKNEGAITAARRTKQYLQSKGLEVPSWLQAATASSSLDASKLTADQQDVLFLGNMRMHPKADLGKVVNGEEDVADFWANYHWAGDPKDRSERIQSFNDSVQRYTQVKPQQLQQNKFVAPKKVNADPRMEAVVTRDNIPTPRQTQQRMLPQQEQVTQAQPQAAPKKPLLDTSIYDDVYSYIKNKNKLTAYNEGGKHEQNPHGGVPIGIGANGLPNTVEEGETSYNFGGDKFVFSDRINVNDKKYGKHMEIPQINNTFAKGGIVNGCGGPGQPPCPPMHISGKDDPRLLVNKVKDNTATVQTSGQMKSQVNNFYKEFMNEQVDKQELKTMGTIKNPKSIAYNIPVTEQPMVKQDTRSESTIRENVKAANEIANTKSVSMLEAPLVYLANPFKAAGDLSEAVGYKNHPFPTSQADAQEIKRQHYFGDRSALEQSMDYAPEAALNLIGGEAASLSKSTKRLSKFWKNRVAKAFGEDATLNLTKGNIEKAINETPDLFFKDMTENYKTFKSDLDERRRKLAFELWEKRGRPTYDGTPAHRYSTPLTEDYFNAEHITRKEYDAYIAEMDEKATPYLQEFKDQERKYFEQPEVQEKLRNLGMYPDKFMKHYDEIDFNIGSSRDGSYYNSESNSIFLGADELIDMNSRNPNFDWRAILRHEVGHGMQGSRGRQRYEYLANKDKLDPNMSSKEKTIYPTNIDGEARDIKSFVKSLDQMSLGDYTRNKGLNSVDDVINDPTYSYSYFDTAGRDAKTDGLEVHLERLPHLREMKQEMVNSGVLSNFGDEVTDEALKRFMKEVPNNRIVQFMSRNKDNKQKVIDILNKVPAAVGAIGTAATIKNKSNER